MKTLTFFSIPAAGHVNPMLVVAEELARRGNRIIFYSFKAYQSRIEEAGIEFRDYGMFEDLDPRIARVPIAAVEKCIEFTEVAAPGLIRNLKEDKADCVVHDGIAIWGKVSAHAAGIKAISFVPNFVFTKSVLLSYVHRNIHMVAQVLGHGRRFLAARKRYYALMKEYGMPRAEFLDVFLNKEPLNIVCTSRKLHPRSRGFHSSFVFIGASLGKVENDTEFMNVLNPEKKTIYISLGTVFNDDPDFYHTCIDTFKNSPFQVVISLGQYLSIDDFKDVPENFILRKYVPQRLLLEKTKIFLTHGGMNSISESIYAGVPMILIPQIDEQRMNSIRVEKLGAGIYLRKHQLSSKSILKATEQILSSDTYRTHTLELQRALLESGGRKKAADKIEEYASLAYMEYKMKKFTSYRIEPDPHISTAPPKMTENTLYEKLIYFVTDTSSIILFFFQTAFKPPEFVYKIGGDSFWVRKNSSDIFVLKEVYGSNIYGEKPGGIVIDVGANIGAFSIYASHTASVVYAFEPESSNYNQLLKNIRLNEARGKIIPHKVAIGGKNRKVHIYKGQFNKGASSTTHRITAVSEIVEMRSLSGLMDELGIDKIDLLKIDIEGGEYDLLYGLPKEKFAKIDKLVLEYHYVPGESYIELKNYLVSFGYKVNIHTGLGFLVGAGNIEAVRR